MGDAYRSHSEADTVRIARDLAAPLPPGTVILLVGELGAGKTAFVRGIVEAAGGRPEDVSSPTFTLIQEYAGRTPVQHVDLYRVTPLEVDDLGLEELVPGHLVAIEWADRLPRPLPGALRVQIEDGGGDERVIQVEGPTRSGSSEPPS